MLVRISIYRKSLIDRVDVKTFLSLFGGRVWGVLGSTYNNLKNLEII
jgi:hypothetical protein